MKIFRASILFYILASAVCILSVFSGATIAGTKVQGSAFVKTEQVKKRTLSSYIKAFGKIEPNPAQLINLSAPHAGIVNKVWIRVGEELAAGAPLLEIIISPEEQMQYLQAKSDLEFAKSEVNRLHSLFDDQMTTKSELNKAINNLSNAKNKVETLEKNKMNMGKLTLRAPKAGIVTTLNVAIGKQVLAKESLLLFSSADSRIARVNILPEQANQFPAETLCLIHSAFAPKIVVSSTISKPGIMIDSQSKKLPVYANIPTEYGNTFILGSHIVANILTQRESQLSISRQAILDDEKGSYVYRVDHGKVQKVYVVTGIQENDRVAISGNISEADRLVIEGNYELEDGMSIREKQL